MDKRKSELVKHRCLRESSGYLDFYRRWMDERMRESPDTAPTDTFTPGENGRMQFAFLRDWGVSEGDDFLEMGCGSFHLGRVLVPWLNAGKYVGTDVSGEAVGESRRVVAADGLTGRRPEIIMTTDLKFGDFNGRRFDVVYAFSVLNHFPVELLREFFNNVGRVLRAKSKILFTVLVDESLRSRGNPPSSFYVSWELLGRIAEVSGFDVAEVGREFWADTIGKRKMRMVEAKWKS